MANELSLFQQEKSKKKWRLWRSASDGYGSAGKISKREFVESTESHDSRLLANAVAAVARAPLKDFVVVRQHWAAVRIQTAFRGFLVRKTFATVFSSSVSLRCFPSSSNL